MSSQCSYPPRKFRLRSDSTTPYMFVYGKPVRHSCSSMTWAARISRPTACQSREVHISISAKVGTTACGTGKASNIHAGPTPDRHRASVHARKCRNNSKEEESTSHPHILHRALATCLSWRDAHQIHTQAKILRAKLNNAPNS